MYSVRLFNNFLIRFDCFKMAAIPSLVQSFWYYEIFVELIKPFEFKVTCNYMPLRFCDLPLKYTRWSFPRQMQVTFLWLTWGTFFLTSLWISICLALLFFYKLCLRNLTVYMFKIKWHRLKTCMIFTQNPTLITGKIYQLLQITLRRTFTQNVE